MTPPEVERPTALFWFSVYQTFPSGPVRIPRGALPGVITGNSLKVCAAAKETHRVRKRPAPDMLFARKQKLPRLFMMFAPRLYDAAPPQRLALGRLFPEAVARDLDAGRCYLVLFVHVA